MKKPLIISCISFCNPNPNKIPKSPAPANTEAVSTPKIDKITNTPTKKPPIEEEYNPEDIENPKTGDDIYKSFIMLLISLAGLTYSTINIKFKKEVE